MPFFISISQPFSKAFNERQASWPNRLHWITYMCILSRIECKKIEIRLAFLYINISAFFLPLCNKRPAFWHYRPHCITCMYVYSEQNRMQKRKNPICLSLYQYLCLFATLSNERHTCWPHCISYICILSRIECEKVENRFAFLYVNISAFFLTFCNKRQACWPNRPFGSFVCVF